MSRLFLSRNIEGATDAGRLWSRWPKAWAAGWRRSWASSVHRTLGVISFVDMLATTPPHSAVAPNAPFLANFRPLRDGHHCRHHDSALAYLRARCLGMQCVAEPSGTSCVVRRRHHRRSLRYGDRPQQMVRKQAAEVATQLKAERVRVERTQAASMLHTGASAFISVGATLEVSQPAVSTDRQPDRQTDGRTDRRPVIQLVRSCALESRPPLLPGMAAYESYESSRGGRALLHTLQPARGR
jgi:hypothetical protein